MPQRQRTAHINPRLTPLAAGERISLTALLQRHATVIRKVPGQEVEMMANDLGCERACIYTVTNSSEHAPQSSIQLLFSIIAFDKQTKPIATLTLLEDYQRVAEPGLSLGSVDRTQDALVLYLKHQNAPLTAYTAIGTYIDAIRAVISTVGDDMVWA